MLSADEVAGIGVAMNEATLLDASVDRDAHQASIVLDVLSLPCEGPAPDDGRVRLVLSGVGRVCATLQDEGRVQPFSLEELSAVVRRAGGAAQYGWEFIDLPFEEHLQPSLDWRDGPDGRHRLLLFQDAVQGNGFEVWIWFDRLQVESLSGDPIALEDFIAGGKRWWDGLYADDPRTRGRGIVRTGDS